MLIYIILLLILFMAAIIFLFNKKTKNRFIFLLFAFVPTFLISAFRSYNVGADTLAYVVLFDELKRMSIQEILNWNIYFETGYLIFNHIIQYFTMNNQAILIVTSLIIISSVFLLIYKYSVSLFFSVYLFITLAFYYNSMNIIRQYIAIAILTYSLSLVKKRKLVPFIIVVFLASLFHSSALIFSIVYLFPLIKFSNRIVLIAIFTSGICTLFLSPLMEWVLMKVPQYQMHMSYMDSNEVASLFKTLILLSILLIGLAVKYHESQNSLLEIKRSTDLRDTIKEKTLNTKKVVIKNSDENILSLIMLFAVLFSLLSIRMSILSRVSEYFAIYSVLYLPNAINKIKSKDIRTSIIILVVFFTLLYNAIIFIYRPEWYQVTPYSLFK
ncbi:EpsG family protein [Candidatus Pristimantibacillus sp. PTI5]|uniref:EpsG family protein n=1 Tax=Candidatus Pristimantibacillus sp. PTI5 TaxID=3400422 RepID=UPI003B01FF6C